MPGNNIKLNDDEMWDDSALVESWNEALEEYKKYHSIHAKGGTIKELQALSASSKASRVGTEADSNDVTMEGEHHEGSETVREPKIESPAPEAAAAAPAIAPPQAVLGTVRDESLKKLLMSWYYAGYYTGLYEGQQAQQQQGPNQPQ